MLPLEGKIHAQTYLFPDLTVLSVIGLDDKAIEDKVSELVKSSI